MCSSVNSSEMKNDLINMYTFLTNMKMKNAANDFYLIRASKQKELHENNPILHEHTSINHYLQWHCAFGTTVPAYCRKSPKTLWAKYKTNACHQLTED